MYVMFYFGQYSFFFRLEIAISGACLVDFSFLMR